MQLIILKPAQKYMDSTNENIRVRLKKAIAKLPTGDVKKMQGFSKDYRLRVGDLRVLFTMEDEVITIREILPRGQVYKRIREECIYDAAGNL